MKRKLKQLEASYGETPDLYYFDGDMNNIRAYFDYCQEHNQDDFLLGDITWNDLNMDNIYKRINHGLSTSGEQYLYYMLRNPVVDDKEEYDKRKTLIELVENDASLRLKLQVMFSKLGRNRHADVCRAFDSRRNAPYLLPLYLLLSVAVMASVVCLPLMHIPIGFVVVLLIVNSFIYKRKD